MRGLSSFYRAFAFPVVLSASASERDLPLSSKRGRRNLGTGRTPKDQLPCGSPRAVANFGIWGVPSKAFRRLLFTVPRVGSPWPCESGSCSSCPERRSSTISARAAEHRSGSGKSLVLPLLPPRWQGPFTIAIGIATGDDRRGVGGHRFGSFSWNMRVVFIGSGEFGIPTLRALAVHRDYRLQGVITQVDRPSGRHRLPTACPAKAAALDLHLPIFQPERISSPTAIEQIRFLQPDVLIVVAYGQILSREVLELPSQAALNLHASLLPRHRGAAPIQAAIRCRDRETGVSVIWMDEGLDTGDILWTKKLLVRSTDTTGTLQERLAKLGARAVVEALDRLASGSAERVAQDPTRATYARKLSREDGEIDWTRDKWEIHAHIRAMNPWPVAYTWLQDGGEARTLKIFRTIASIRASGKPGEVVRIDSHGILVAAGGTGGLLLRDVQLEGKRRMAAAEFARGVRLSVGSVLGGERLPVGHDRAAGGTLS